MPEPGRPAHRETRVTPWHRRASLACSVALALLSACASVLPDFQEAPQPAAPQEAGQVVLFTGLNWSGESHRATGTDALAQDIRRAGVPSHVHRPGNWAKAAEAWLAQGARAGPVAVYGYSAGGPAAARFAERLGEAGLRVETLVVLESWQAVRVPCNVGAAVQYRLEDGEALVPKTPGCVPVRNIVIDDALTARRDGLGHLSVAVDAAVMRAMLGELLQDGQVRRRGETAGR